VVFSLLHDPAPTGFPVDRNPRIDEPVMAVGNALGEGIVIRDGLYTSATDEEQDGQWKWIRFSAAASPGNSGGPLLDGDGKVIGIVIGKSPNENLNYSLPIGRALVAEEHKAKFDQRGLTTLPYLHATYPYAYQDSFDLPLGWSAFADAYQSLVARHSEDATAALLKANNDSLFPRGRGSDSLLFEPDANGFQPFLITQQDDAAWGASKPDFVQTALPGDGSVDVASVAGVTLLRLIRPNVAADDAFYSDSQAFMDLALEALNIRRPVGQDQVRITSLGSARTEASFTDQYRRVWQERVWAVPALDIYVVAQLLPTPDGYVALISYIPSPYLREGESHLRLLTGQLAVSLRGSLKQWQAYLHRRATLPYALNEVHVGTSPGWTFQSPESLLPCAPLHWR
jgi:serine protease Do